MKDLIYLSGSHQPLAFGELRLHLYLFIIFSLVILILEQHVLDELQHLANEVVDLERTHYLLIDEGGVFFKENLGDFFGVSEQNQSIELDQEHVFFLVGGSPFVEEPELGRVEIEKEPHGTK